MLRSLILELVPKKQHDLRKTLETALPLLSRSSCIVVKLYTFATSRSALHGGVNQFEVLTESPYLPNATDPEAGLFSTSDISQATGTTSELVMVLERRHWAPGCELTNVTRARFNKSESCLALASRMIVGMIYLVDSEYDVPHPEIRE